MDVLTFRRHAETLLNQMGTKRFPHHAHIPDIRRVLAIPLAACVLFASHLSHAKIVDCPPVVADGVEYSSHANYVQATARASGEVIWKTVLFADTYARKPNPRLEEDVQWNIACIREVGQDEVFATDLLQRVFRLNKSSGKLLDVTRRSRGANSNADSDHHRTAGHPAASST